MSALLFFDIDGTLLTLDGRHAMPESTKDALLKAKENGHKIFINTGRVKTAIDKLLLNFGFDGLVCGCGTYVEYRGKAVLHQILPKEKCVEYAAKLREYGYQAVFEGKERLFIDGDHGPGSFMEYIFNYFSQNSDYPIEESGHPEFIFDKFTAAQTPDGDRDAFWNFFSAEFNLISHTDTVIEAVPLGCSKATGIRYLTDYLGVPLKNCYAFGDSVNDLEMLQYVSHSVAMGNAAETIKETAEYSTTDIEQDGIWNALRHYGLI
ncbi:MAG: Cof-type HAD-IIB family hydrolase [Bacteroidales bacterium]|nr:Cof-type HAD-IIB family hydrolase [Clostridium sp.]MCM1203221.1 Cof-type HAD-IIB family hydrolase [Bacteroidales bacterium]